MSYQVPRLTTTNPMKMHHRHLGHQLDPDPPSQGFGSGSSSQRKWRVLVSIGLLLPALAAIIAIVAWTISIEVANSNTSPMANQAAALAMAQVRRAERVQRQQQFRRDEVAVLEEKKQRQRDQQQPASAMKTSKRQAARTNLEQLETLTSSSQETRSLPGPAKDQEERDDKAKRKQKRDEEKTSDEMKRTFERTSERAQDREDKMSEQSSGSRETPAPEQAADEGTDRSTSASSNPVTKPDEQDQGFEQAQIEQETLSGDDEKDNQQQQQVASGEQSREKSESRWMSMANGASKRPMKPVVETGKKLASAKQVYLESNQNKKQSHRFGGTKSSTSLAKSNSEYKLLAPSEPVAMTNERDEEEQVPSSTSQPPTSTTVAVETTTSVRDCADKNNKQRVESSETPSDDSAGTSQANSQDEVSFEAIASAISKSLSDSQMTTGSEAESGGDSEAPARAMAEMLSDAVASNAKPRQESSSADDESETNARETAEGAGDERRSADDVAQRAAKRRRTTGEHLAEVIDHIVEKRNHQRQARFGDRTAADEDSSSQHQVDYREGPQIVVVAPVGPNGALLKARSLTKEPAKSDGKSSSTPVAKKFSEPAKKKAQQQKVMRIGGRLLGVDSNEAPSKSDQSNQMKFSERVEVIEDDDSSSLLLPSPAPDAIVRGRSIASDEAEKLVDSADGSSENDDDDIESEERKSSERNQMTSQQADLLALSHEQLSSVHVSSNSAEARSRSPRHDSRQIFERYAPMPQQQQQQQQQQSQQQKLYTAEQVIMEHMLKSKARLQNNDQQQRTQTAQQQGEQTKKQRAVSSSGKATPQETSSTTSASVQTTSTTTNQTPAAAAIAAGDQREPNKQLEQTSGPQQKLSRARQQPDQTIPATASDQSEVRPNGERHYQSQEQQAGEYASMQLVQVPALFMQHRNQMQRQFRPSNLQDFYQTMESQKQQVQMVRPSGGAYEPAQDQPTGGESQRDQQSANENQYNNQQQQQQAQQTLPVFADQEIQVPAHMAESVIRDLQQAPSTVQGVLNGQSALFQAQPTMMAQVPSQQPHHHQNQHLGQQHQIMMMMMQQQQQQHHQQQPHHMNPAESHQRPAFAAANEQIQQQQRQQQQPQTSYLRQALGYSPLALMSRLTSARRHPNEQHQQLMHHDQMRHDRQVLASRASVKDESKKQQQVPDQPQESSLLDTAVKALGPKGLIQPVAQMALKNLFSSLGQQAAAQQAQADAQEIRHRSNQQRSSQQAMVTSQQALEGASIQEPIAAGSSPTAVISELPQGGRSMRSLPIGAQAPPSQQQMQPIGLAGASGANTGDQDVQESYGQMPAYHMAPGPHYQGGGGHGDSYQGDHDKKTKGITFHFGGGPIGGGTQLITSPMGIFKHLMIPLMPNPRVNLNGKVVFGVVLEKSTAFGPPPKKKHFLWG